MISSRFTSLRWQKAFPYASVLMIAVGSGLLILALLDLVLIPIRIIFPSKKFSSEMVPMEAAKLQPKPLAEMQSEFSTHSLFYSASLQSPEPSGPGASEELRAFQLVGIIQGQTPEALIKNIAFDQTYFVREGEKFDRFQVAKIESHQITVESGGQSFSMALEGGIS